MSDTITVQADEKVQTNSTVHDTSARKMAGLAFVLAGVAVVASFGMAMSGPDYDNPVFVYFHAGLFLATVFTAVGASALVYAVGVRRLGPAGIIGGAFTWLGVGSGLFWLMLAWVVGSTAMAGNSIDDLLIVTSPMGTGLFVVTGTFVMVGLAAIAVGLRRVDIIPSFLAGAGMLLGVVGAALFALLVLGAAMATVEASILLVVLGWLWTLPLGIALVRGGRLTAQADAEIATNR